MFKIMITLLPLMSTSLWAQYTIPDPIADVPPAIQALLDKSDQELWDLGLTAQVGKCRISDATNAASFCDYYALSDKEFTGTTNMGLPGKSALPYGTGCLVAPDAPKGRNTCWGGSNVYPLYTNALPHLPICTPAHVVNGANMLRNALVDPADYCDRAAIVEASTPTSSGGGSGSTGNGSTGSTSTLIGHLTSGRKKYNSTNYNDCRAESTQEVLVNNVSVRPLIRLSDSLCRRLLKYYRNEFGLSAEVPTLEIGESDLGSAVGALSPQQFYALRQVDFFNANQAIYGVAAANSAPDTLSVTKVASPSITLSTTKIKSLVSSSLKSTRYSKYSTLPKN